jgi:hypothetical protein
VVKRSNIPQTALVATLDTLDNLDPHVLFWPPIRKILNLLRYVRKSTKIKKDIL